MNQSLQDQFFAEESMARLVLGEERVLVLAGIVHGLVSSIATRALQAMLYESSDPSVLLAVAGFAAAALIGCYLPARRASQIDPSETLRSEITCYFLSAALLSLAIEMEVAEEIGNPLGLADLIKGSVGRAHPTKLCFLEDRESAQVGMGEVQSVSPP